MSGRKLLDPTTYVPGKKKKMRKIILSILPENRRDRILTVLRIFSSNYIILSRMPRSGVRYPEKAKTFRPSVRAYTQSGILSPGLKQPESEVDHFRNSEVTTEQSCTSVSPPCLPTGDKNKFSFASYNLYAWQLLLNILHLDLHVGKYSDLHNIRLQFTSDMDRGCFNALISCEIVRPKNAGIYF